MAIIVASMRAKRILCLRLRCAYAFYIVVVIANIHYSIVDVIIISILSNTNIILIVNIIIITIIVVLFIIIITINFVLTMPSSLHFSMLS